VPFKTLSFGNGVNYTAGLNRVRTSPDHGTAYDIAGKGKADFNSFKEAVYLAIDIFNSRIQYAEISQRPLKIKELHLLICCIILLMYKEFISFLLRLIIASRRSCS
jgi:4-hydroxythreonine-4-phosphate dehydrogenase